VELKLKSIRGTMPRDTYQDDSDATDMSPIDLSTLNFVGPDDKLAESIASVEAEQALVAATPVVEAVLQSPVVPAVLAESNLKVEPIKEWHIGSTHIKNPA
jgi:hypothetical protein